MREALFWVSIGILISAVIRWSWDAVVDVRKRRWSDLLMIIFTTVTCAIMIAAKVTQ